MMMMMMMMTMTIMNSYRIHADNPYQQQNEIMFTKNNFWRIELVEASWNVMARAQKTDFIIRQNGRVHLSRRRRQFSRLLADEVCASALVMLDTPCSEVVWRVLATHSIRQFPLHFPSRASPFAITFQLESTTMRFRILATLPLLVISELWHMKPSRHVQFSAMIWNIRCGSSDSIITFSCEEVPIKVPDILSDCALSQPRKPLVEV